MQRLKVHIVDPDPERSCAIVDLLESEAVKVVASVTLPSVPTPSYDMVITSIVPNHGDLETIFPDTVILLLDAAGQSNPAYEVLTYPFEKEQLAPIVRRAAHWRRVMDRHAAEKQHLLGAVGEQAVRLQEALSYLERSYDITLEALGDALDLRDEETEGHSRRVTAYTIVLARCMKVSDAELRVIIHGAFLHDIGKIAIPDAILLKEGPLTFEENLVMRSHCARGFSIVHRIPFLRDAAEIVHSHQERYDGTGYPRALRGEEIPLGARIFAIADTLDAITSRRPYRQARSFQAAFDEICRHAGTQFDPDVVEQFRKLPLALWHDLRQEINLRFATEI